ECDSENRRAFQDRDRRPWRVESDADVRIQPEVAVEAADSFDDDGAVPQRALQAVQSIEKLADTFGSRRRREVRNPQVACTEVDGRRHRELDAAALGIENPRF